MEMKSARAIHRGVGRVEVVAKGPGPNPDADLLPLEEHGQAAVVRHPGVAAAGRHVPRKGEGGGTSAGAGK